MVTRMFRCVVCSFSLFLNVYVTVCSVQKLYLPVGGGITPLCLEHFPLQPVCPSVCLYVVLCACRGCVEVEEGVLRSF